MLINWLLSDGVTALMNVELAPPPTPKPIWLADEWMMILSWNVALPENVIPLANVFAPLIICRPSVMTNEELAPVSGIVYWRFPVGDATVISVVLGDPFVANVISELSWLLRLKNPLMVNVVFITHVSLNVLTLLKMLIPVNMFVAVIVCVPSVMRNPEFPPVSGIV